MKRFPITLLAFLLTTALAGLSFAAEEPAVQAESPEAAQSAEASESCNSSLDLSISFATPATELASTDASSLDCNCNRNEDCKRACGDKGSGTCFIGPVCNNWPDYTGKCICSKQGEPQGL
jgi:hypothetical protein